MSRKLKPMRASDGEVVDAIRLALVGAGDDAAALAVIRELVTRAPEPDAKGTRSVQVLLDAVRWARLRLGPGVG